MDSRTQIQAEGMRCCGPEGCGRVVSSTMTVAECGGIVQSERMCIGSRCMAWRTTGFRRGETTHFMSAAAVKDVIKNDPNVDVVGCCGLACVPEQNPEPTTMVPFVPPTKPPRRPWWAIFRGGRSQYLEDAYEFLCRRVDAIERHVNRRRL